MKKILSLLMCYVFLQAETFALRGGPGGTGNSQLAGAYSALLIQTSPLFDIQGNQIGTAPGSGLGLLLLSVPASGPAVGNMLLFDSQTGGTFMGKANGLSNVQTGELVCLVFGSEFQFSTPGTTLAAPQTIAGRMTVSKNKLKKTSREIIGTANLTVAGIPFVDVDTGTEFVRNGVPTTFDVVGYLTGSSDAIPGIFDVTVPGGGAGGGTTPTPTPRP